MRRAPLGLGWAWLLLLTILVTIGFLAAGDPLPGLRQRTLIVAGAMWQLTLLWREEQRSEGLAFIARGRRL